MCRSHRPAPSLLFEVFSQRYERGSTVVTSNLPFDEWTSVFGSERLTGALLDRLTHHVHILQMNGDSYRLNQSKRRLTPCQLGYAGGSSHPSLMPDEKAPSSGVFLPASLMYFCSGEPMHFCSGVDSGPHRARTRRLASSGHPRSTHPINLSVRRGMPRARSRRCSRAPRLQHRSHAAPSRRNRNQSYPRRTCHSHSRSSRMARRQRPQGSQKHLAPAAAAACARAQPSRKHLAVHAGELAVKPYLQILRRHRRPLLLRLEHAHRPALENHVHRSPRLGSRRSLIVRIGIRGPLQKLWSARRHLPNSWATGIVRT